MNNTKKGMIPILTTPAGSCLTGANWQEVGVNVASFYLTDLLMKPGYPFLKSFPNLADYVGWQGEWVLNASSLMMAADGLYTLRSHYDGSRSQYSLDEILDLIIALQPNIVILPEGISQQVHTRLASLPATIMPFVHATDLIQSLQRLKTCGVYIRYDKAASDHSILFKQLEKFKDTASYIMGDLNLPLMRDLMAHGATWVESDLPANDAYEGDVYSGDVTFSLKGSDYHAQFDVIDGKCKCPTCDQKFTKSYLHHLLEHTPLLCQRFLIQHNLYYCQQKFL